MEVERVPLNSLKPHPRNPRQGDVGAISESLKAHGQYRPIVAQRSTGHILAGNHTWKAAKALKWKEIDAVFVDVSDDEAYRILLVDNRSGDLADYDNNELVTLLQELTATELGLEGTGYDGDALDELLAELNGTGPLADDTDPEQARRTLAERFGVPPFSVLDARQGYWQARKRAWLALGIQSELGRGGGTWRESQTGSPIDRQRAYSEG